MRWRSYLRVVSGLGLSALGLASLGLAVAVGLGCAGPRVVIERGEGLTLPPSWRSWDWSREVRPVIDVPPAEAGILHPQVVALVGRVLQDRGYQRVRHRPDLLVTYRLEIVRELVITREKLPQQSISGVSLKGSYHIENTRLRERTYERVRLWIGVMSAQDSSVFWAGRFEVRVRNRFEPHLTQAVAQLLERFPEAAPLELPLIHPDPTAPGPRTLTAQSGEQVGNSQAR